MGTLERLQKYALEYLRGLSDLKYADIRAENFSPLPESGKAEGMRVEILCPVPLAASKYAAGPTFSDVELSVRVTRDDAVAMRAPSTLTACEILSRALHNWTPPAECGYGKITLAPNSPWTREASAPNSTRFVIKFKAQSVLS